MFNTSINDATPQLLRSWRENYTWIDQTREQSEKRILSLENRVIEEIYRKGLSESKNVLSDIINWKTNDKPSLFQNNAAPDVAKKVGTVIQRLHVEPDDVEYCIKEFALNDKLRGVGIPVASAFLRFLDPIHHRYGIIDRFVARKLNSDGITNFEYDLNDKYLANSERNAKEYQKFHLWLKQKTIQLAGITFENINGGFSLFSPVDVEMAIFAAYNPQAKKIATK